MKDYTIDDLMELDEVPDTAICEKCGEVCQALYFFGNQFVCPEHGYFERPQ